MGITGCLNLLYPMPPIEAVKTRYAPTTIKTISCAPFAHRLEKTPIVASDQYAKSTMNKGSFRIHLSLAPSEEVGSTLIMSSKSVAPVSRKVVDRVFNTQREERPQILKTSLIPSLPLYRYISPSIDLVLCPRSLFGVKRKIGFRHAVSHFH